MNSIVITGGAAILKKKPVLDASFPIYSIEDISYPDLIGKRGLQFLTPATKMSLAASVLAWEHAGLSEVPPERGGVVLATNMASIYHTTHFDWQSLNQGVNCVSPMQGPNLLLNAPSSRLGIFHKLRGFNTTISSGRVASLDAIEYAVNAIKRKEVDICVVAGVEELSEEYVHWFHQNGLIQEGEDHDLNEGAGVLILESGEYAMKRNATIYGEIKGFASVFDPDAIAGTAEDLILERSYQMMMNQLIEEMNVSTSDIVEVCIADDQLKQKQEAEKKWVYNHLSKEIHVIEHFTQMGELYGASGMMQVMLSLQSVRSGLRLILSSDWYGNHRTVLLNKGV